METVVFEDSPLAQFLEGNSQHRDFGKATKDLQTVGEGEGEEAWSATILTEGPPSPQDPPLFAPTRHLQMPPKIRKQPTQTLTLDRSTPMGAIIYIHQICSVCLLMSCESARTDTINKSAVHSRLGWIQNTQFLERFRYNIVASQLLSERSNSAAHRRHRNLQAQDSETNRYDPENKTVASPIGLCWTAFVAFVLVFSIRWLRQRVDLSLNVPRMILLSIGLASFSTVVYSYLRRQWLHRLRLRAIENASELTGNMQEFDAAVWAGVTLIQEVELVSRGYHM